MRLLKNYCLFFYQVSGINFINFGFKFFANTQAVQDFEITLMFAPKLFPPKLFPPHPNISTANLGAILLSFSIESSDASLSDFPAKQCLLVGQL